MGSISPFKGVRKRRDARREKRRERRKLVKTGPKKQSYGGDEEALKEERESSAKRVDESQEQYKTATGKMDEATDRADELEKRSGTAYATDRVNSLQSRTAQQDAIGGIGAGASSAVAMRDKALADNNLNTIAEQNIAANQVNAGQVLNNQVGMLRRGAIGQAGAMGESGALGVQQALASSGASAGDLAAQNALAQAQLAAQTRFNAGNQQVANALGVADANAGTTYDAGLQTAGQTAVMRGADQQAQDASSARQLNLLGQRIGSAQTGGAAALENQNQMLRNQQIVNTAQLGVDQKAAADAYEAAKNGGITGFLGRVKNFGSNAKGAADSLDAGPTKSLLG